MVDRGSNARLDDGLNGGLGSGINAEHLVNEHWVRWESYWVKYWFGH